MKEQDEIVTKTEFDVTVSKHAIFDRSLLQLLS